MSETRPLVHSLVRLPRRQQRQRCRLLPFVELAQGFGAEVLAALLPLVVLLGEYGQNKTADARLGGEILRHVVRRLISRLSRSSGLFDQSCRQCLGGNARYASTSASASPMSCASRGNG